MSKSVLQEDFLRELAVNFQATADNISKRIASIEDPGKRNATIRDELRGLCHGVLVMFDGGTALADKGLIQIVDEDGNQFDRYLHEICFRYWPK